MSALSRVRQHAGPLSLLAVVAAFAAFLATAAPRVLHRIEDDALRAEISGSPSSIRDLVVTADLAHPERGDIPQTRDRVEAALPGVLRDAVSHRWHAVQTEAGTGISDAFPDYEGSPPEVDLRMQDGLADAVRLIAGALPARPTLREGGGPVELEATVSTATAATLRLRAGDTFLITPHDAGVPTLRITVSGVFRPKRASAPIWHGHPQSVRPAIPRPFQSQPPTYLATVLVHPEAADVLTTIRWDSEVAYRYRLDERRLHAGQAGELAAGLRRVYAGQHGVPGGSLRTGLDHLVADFQAQRATVLAVVAVVFAGLVGSLLGVLLLAARLGAERRRAELRLWRARGASYRGIMGRTAADAALFTVPAVLAGILLALAIPARGETVPWLALAIGAAAVAAVPGFAARLTPGDNVAVRDETALLRPSLRRLTLEATALLLAVVAVLLLRRRGLALADGIDPYLSATPVLCGLALALLALRLYPWPLRLAGRLAARLRGAVHFLGAARAGRAAPAVALPLTVLIVAITVGVFSGVVRASVDEARDRAAWQQVGADVRLRGVAFDRSAPAALADVTGVRAAAAMTVAPSTALHADVESGAKLGAAIVVAVDAPAYQRVLRAAGVDYRLPESLIGARAGAAALPALASPAAAKLAARGRLSLGSGMHHYRVADVVAAFPGLASDTEVFLVLPLQAMPADGANRVLATELVVAGSGADLTQLTAAAAEQQRRAVARTTGRDAAAVADPVVQTRAERRAEAERSGLNLALTAGFAAGAGGAAGFALIAVGFAVVVSAPSRGRAVSRLRTLGLSQGGARALLAWEVGPLLALALAAGTALGVGLPWLLAPVLGLERFTAGATPRVVADPYVLGLTAALAAVTAAAALAWEAAVRRRMTVGGVLRLGEDE